MTEEKEGIFTNLARVRYVKNSLKMKKIRDHYHITGKFSGAAHWSCNINLQLTKNVPVIFHNLKFDDSHLTFMNLKNWM